MKPELREDLVAERDALAKQIETLETLRKRKEAIDQLLDVWPADDPHIGNGTRNGNLPQTSPAESKHESPKLGKLIGPTEAVRKQLESQPKRNWEATHLRDGYVRIIEDGVARPSDDPIHDVHVVLRRFRRNHTVRKTKAGRYRLIKEEGAPSNQ